MFTIEMLPAGHGDCLWIEYGSSRNPRRLLVDVGVDGTYAALGRRAKRVRGHCAFELLIVSHIDGDHIGGAVKLLGTPPAGVTFRDIWFNGWKHLPDDGNIRLSVADAEALSERIAQLGLPWNEAFAGGAVAIDDDLPIVQLAGGLTLTLLSPTLNELRRLRGVWKRECEKIEIAAAAGKPGQREGLGADIDVRGLASRRFTGNRSESNGSSIAVLAEYDGHAALLCADAFPTVIEKSVDRLLARRGKTRLQLDAYKVSHHGSKGNTSPSLLAKIRSPRFLISTNGDIFHHPDDEAVARIVASPHDGVELCFNYRSAQTERWDVPAYRNEFRYRVAYGGNDTGLTVKLA